VEQVKTDSCFGYQGKTGEERNLLIFQYTPMNNHINGELTTTSIRSFVDWFIFEINQITLSPFFFTFIPKTGVGLPSTGCFYCSRGLKIYL